MKQMKWFNKFMDKIPIKFYVSVIFCLTLIIFLGGVYLGENITETTKATPALRAQLHSVTQFSDGNILLSGLPDGTQLQTVANSDSMKPAIMYGSLLVMAPVVDVSILQAGDVIDFLVADGSMVVHRIVSIGADAEGWYCITRGDNTHGRDKAVVRAGSVKYVLCGIIY